MGQVKALALLPLPSKAPGPVPVPPKLLRQSRAIDLAALPFKTLLAQRPVRIV